MSRAYFDKRYVVALSGCWDWTGTRSSKEGYGQVAVNNKTLRAHRLAWELFRGPVPAGRQVLHKCDRPICVNPDHLFLGSHDDNMADKKRKGRQYKAKGERHQLSKLTALQVLEMRIAHAAGQASYSELAVRFAVHVQTIAAVIQRKTWAHV